MHPISNRRPSETKLTYVEDLVDLPFHVAKGFHPEVMVPGTLQLLRYESVPAHVATCVYLAQLGCDSEGGSVSVPVLFRWADSAEHYDVGHSGNVGLGGMFILTSKCPPVGTEVEIDFAIPAFDRIPRQVRFCCKGRVTRVESCYEVAGFAVVGRTESGQLGDDIEEEAAGLLNASNALRC